MAILKHETRPLHYQLLISECDTAPIVVYFHGLLMDNLSSGYFTFADSVRQHAHVLLFDLIGHGKSPIVTEGYRISDHLGDIARLLDVVQRELDIHFNHPDHQSERSLIFMGCSFGGALALASSLSFSKASATILLEGHLGSEPFIRKLQLDLTAEGKQANELIFQHFQHWLHRGSQRKRRRLEDRARSLITGTSLLSDLGREPLDINSLITPKAIDLPLFGLYGTESDALSPVLDLFQKRRNIGKGNDELVLFKDATHALLWEYPEQVIQRICECVIKAQALQRDMIV